MRSAFFYTLVITVASVFSQQPFVRYSGNLRKAVPPHYNHDQKNANRGVDKITRGHKVEPRQPPLRPQPEVPWLRWVHEGRWAAQADRNTELHKVRARLLEEKLKPNQFAFRPRINPQVKPKLKPKENTRIKREAGHTEVETVQKETEVKENVRLKREAIMPQLVPEMIMQPDLEAKMPQPNDQIGGRIKESEKREKRQILYFFNRPPQLLARSPRTTPNPFIRDTHIEEYDIIRPEVGEREGMIPTVETGSSDPDSYPLVNEESTEFSKIISQFYLMTSDEHWPEIQRFAENILKPLFQLTVKKDELIETLKSVEDINENDRTMVNPLNNIVERHQTSSLNKDIDGMTHNRVKRRVNKTLKRKRAKKKKQRLRRFERKRLRMLTHARRVRRQQKSKQARLQRHYARMNMSTMATPERFRNQTLVGEVEDYDENQTKSKDDEEETGEEHEEYESSEYEDESEESESDSKDKSEESESDSNDKSEGKISKESQEDNEEYDENETEESIGSKPDYGNDDYEEYDDESDDDYEEDGSSEEESDKKKKKSRKGKKIKAGMKSGKKRMLHTLSRHTNNQGKENHRNNPKEINFNKENPHFINGNIKLNKKINYKQNRDKDFERNKVLNLKKQSSPLRNDGAQINDQYYKENMASKHLKIGKENRHEKSGHEVNIAAMVTGLKDNTRWSPGMGSKKLINEGKFQPIKK